MKITINWDEGYTPQQTMTLVLDVYQKQKELLKTLVEEYERLKHEYDDEPFSMHNFWPMQSIWDQIENELGIDPKLVLK